MVSELMQHNVCGGDGGRGGGAPGWTMTVYFAVYVVAAVDNELMLPPSYRKWSTFSTTLTDLLRKAPRAGFRLLTSFSPLLVACMC